MSGNLLDRAFESFKRIGEGLKTVLMHSLREPITLEYPDIVTEMKPHFRGRLALTVNPDTGEHLCISCRQCERVCPDKCIDINAHNRATDLRIDYPCCSNDDSRYSIVDTLHHTRHVDHRG